MAQIITSSGTDLKYDGTDFDDPGNYVNIAKAAVEYFARWVHDTYITGGWATVWDTAV